ncbi:MarR family winged helix-turn-helix transcriptional regulator [Paenibacillus sp. MY03]|uniref:MarR family winged helix-turn-helix transcriptional regulator n=1 Tax=Paenibacillus sp. MY03 TaxID=302980 RepID=UPI00211B6CD7|nr:MarR family transcriptional regulator [Paenibacillus sp. MY03]
MSNNCHGDMIKELIHRYERAHFTVERKLYALLRDLMPAELTVDQFNMIRFLQFNGRSTPSELAEVFGVGKSSITAIISRLSDKGFIRRLSEESDRRIVILTLTEEGKRLCESIDARVEAMLADIMNHFEEEEAERFISTFEKLADVMAGTAGLGSNEGNE